MKTKPITVEVYLPNGQLWNTFECDRIERSDANARIVDLLNADGKIVAQVPTSHPLVIIR